MIPNNPGIYNVHYRPILCSVITKSSQTKDQHQLRNCTKEEDVSHFWIIIRYQGVTIYNTGKSSTWALQNDSHKFDGVMLILNRHACTLDYTCLHIQLWYTQNQLLFPSVGNYFNIWNMKKKFFNDFILKLVLFF